jgi:hypothetical protein
MGNLQHDPEVRLECLKLAHRPDRSPSEVIAVAREYLAWVGGVPVPTTGENRPGDSQKVGKTAPADPARTSLPKSAAKAAPV